MTSNFSFIPRNWASIAQTPKEVRLLINFGSTSLQFKKVYNKRK